MSTSRKCYFHAKRGMAPRVPCQRPRSKSSELFDEVVGGEMADLEAPPLPAGGPNTTWSSQVSSKVGGKKQKKKELRSDDKISYRGAVYKCSPFCPSPVKPSSQPNPDMLVSMEMVSMATDTDQDMDTEDVFETKLPSAMTAVADDDGSSDACSNVIGQGHGKNRTKVANLKVFDFDFEDSDGSAGSEVKVGVVSDKAALRPPTGVVAGSNTRKYNTIRNLGRRKVTMLGGGRGDRTRKRGEQDVKGGSGRVAKEVGGRSMAMGNRSKVGMGQRKVVGAKGMGETRTARADQRSGVDNEDIGGRHGNSRGGGGHHGDEKCGVADQKEKQLLTDLISTAHPNFLSESSAKLSHFDSSQTYPISHSGPTKSGSSIPSEDTHSNSRTSSKMVSRMRQVDPASASEQTEISSKITTPLENNDTVPHSKPTSKASRSGINSKTKVTQRSANASREKLSAHVKEDRLDEATSSGVDSRIYDDMLDFNQLIELPGHVKSVSSVAAGSNVRQSMKITTATAKRRAPHRDLSDVQTSQAQSQAPAIQGIERKNQDVSTDVSKAGDVASYGDVEDQDSRLNGLWSATDSSKQRVGKRKRAWLVEHTEEKSTNSADPYAFDFSEETNSPSKMGSSFEAGAANAGSNTHNKKLPESKIFRADYSRKRPVAVRKTSEEMDSDMLHEIDTMLEGYEEEKDEEEDMASRLSPNVTLTEPKVARLKKYTSEGGQAKTRRYAYTTRQAPVPGEGGGAVPRLKKSLTWPRRPRKGAEDVIKTASPLLSIGESMESGETRQFFEEIHYLLDSMKPCRPVHTRCLSTCNLASQFLDSDFSRQVRAHDFTDKIVAVLQDTLEVHSLCVCASVLFYVMTRDKLCINLGEGGVNLLVGMLTLPTFDPEQLEGREAKDWQKVEEQARGVLEQVADHTSQGINTPPPEEEEDEDLVPLSQPTTSSQEVSDKKSDRKRRGFRVATDNISPAELARECIISLSAPQNDPQKLREELRSRGALDHLANMVITSCEDLSSRDYSRPETITNEVVHSVSRQASVLDRQLKSIEHLTLMNRSNQSYLVIFDGSVLVSRLAQFLEVGHGWLDNPVLRCSGQMCLLAVLKILINLTHESDLGSHRLGEQKDIMTSILNIILRCPQEVSESDKFDLSIMALILVINLIEQSTTNCHKLESVSVDSLKGGQSEVATPPQGGSCNGAVAPRGSVLPVLVQVFLNLCDKADSTVINVPTPQRLSQISSNSSPSSQNSNRPRPSSQDSSPGKALAATKRGGASCKADLTTRLSNNVKGYSSSRALDAEVSSSQESPHPLGQATRADKRGVASSSREAVASDDEDEECEPIEMDALVFDRDEYNSALDQAGRQMEDSLLSSYLALVLGIVAEKDFDMVDVIRDLMPSRSFSEMLKMLKKFVSFMSMTGSDVGLESVKHTIKYLEAIQPRT